jgi:hypothetical protein
MNDNDWKILAKHRVKPDNLSVGRWLDLRDTAIAALYTSNHGYRLDRAGSSYIAGCRNFTAAEALAHWGGDEYQDKRRGAEFCAAVTAEEARRAAQQETAE